CDCGSVHFGGSGVPLYVVQLTEQEAVEVIQNKAEHMGLDLRGTPPNVSVTVGTGQWNQRTIAPMLFDEENNIALAHVGVTDRWDWWGDPETARLAQEAFDEKEGDLNVGVFYSRGEGVWCKSRNDQVREDLKQHLSAQVREFIENLQAQGII
ncbi:MAG: hypothetical protein FWC11_07005, partial [Firmicutes bacterium]|nr:hypothetical protein [Bacillota bacterium]